MLAHTYLSLCCLSMVAYVLYAGVSELCNPSVPFSVMSLDIRRYHDFGSMVDALSQVGLRMVCHGQLLDDSPLITNAV